MTGHARRSRRGKRRPERAAREGNVERDALPNRPFRGLVRGGEPGEGAGIEGQVGRAGDALPLVLAGVRRLGVLPVVWAALQRGPRALLELSDQRYRTSGRERYCPPSGCPRGAQFFSAG